MKDIKINLKTKSGFSNLFTADQIWGQMVWAISDLEGSDTATKFVEDFIKSPPFLISSMFPQDYFPRIVLPPVKNESVSSFSEERENRRLAKSNKKKEWIPIDVLLQYQKNINKLKLATFEDQPTISKINEIKTSIDRETWSANEGGLFNQTYLYSEETFVIYIKLLSDDKKRILTLEKIIEYFNLFGLGGDKNIGKGNFQLSINELSDNEKTLFEYNEGNVFTSLSRCSGKDLNPLFYQVKYYFGISGRSLTETKIYNKYPVVYYEPGSIFKNGKGSIIENVQDNSNACSYGYSFPLNLNIKETV